MPKQKVLIQIDSDRIASVFDSMVAIDSGIDQLLVKDGIAVDDVTSIVHGAIFTRGMGDLKRTALFFGGSNVDATEALVAQAKKSFFGPMQVSLMSDPNGSNTTAAAAVLCAGKHLDWSNKTVTVLGGTGPVGQRIAAILSRLPVEGMTIRVCSRKKERAKAVSQKLAKDNVDLSVKAEVKFVPLETTDSTATLNATNQTDVVFAAGAAGIELLPSEWMSIASTRPGIVVDLNAVPPAGIAGVEVTDNGRESDGTIFYGAIGVGGLKMKIHRRCIESLFESNDRIFEINEIFEVGNSLVK